MLLIILTFFSDYFPGESVEPNNHYINNVVFSNLKTTVRGAAVSLVNLENSKIVIESSVFYYCWATGSSIVGGAVAIQNTNNCPVVTAKVCAAYCRTDTGDGDGTTLRGQFCYIETGKTDINNAFFLSVTKCAYITNNGRDPIRLQQGVQIIKNCNSSLNTVAFYSGALFSTQSSANSSYCTISNNIGKSMCFGIWNSALSYHVFNNIICNNSPNGYGIIHSVSCNSFFEMCVFSLNQNKLFCCYSGSMLVKYCFIDTISYTYTSPSMVSNSGKTSSFLLKHFNSHACPADHPYQDTSYLIRRIGPNYLVLGLFYIL